MSYSERRDSDSLSIASILSAPIGNMRRSRQRDRSRSPTSPPRNSNQKLPRWSSQNDSSGRKKRKLKDVIGKVIEIRRPFGAVIEFKDPLTKRAETAFAFITCCSHDGDRLTKDDNISDYISIGLEVIFDAVGVDSPANSHDCKWRCEPLYVEMLPSGCDSSPHENSNEENEEKSMEAVLGTVSGITGNISGVFKFELFGKTEQVFFKRQNVFRQGHKLSSSVHIADIVPTGTKVLATVERMDKPQSGCFWQAKMVWESSDLKPSPKKPGKSERGRGNSEHQRGNSHQRSNTSGRNNRALSEVNKMASPQNQDRNHDLKGDKPEQQNGHRRRSDGPQGNGYDRSPQNNKRHAADDVKSISEPEPIALNNGVHDAVGEIVKFVSDYGAVARFFFKDRIQYVFISQETFRGVDGHRLTLSQKLSEILRKDDVVVFDAEPMRSMLAQECHWTALKVSLVEGATGGTRMEVDTQAKPKEIKMETEIPPERNNSVYREPKPKYTTGNNAKRGYADMQPPMRGYFGSQDLERPFEDMDHHEMPKRADVVHNGHDANTLSRIGTSAGNSGSARNNRSRKIENLAPLVDTEIDVVSLGDPEVCSEQPSTYDNMNGMAPSTSQIQQNEDSTSFEQDQDTTMVNTTVSPTSALGHNDSNDVTNQATAALAPFPASEVRPSAEPNQLAQESTVPLFPLHPILRKLLETELAKEFSRRMPAKAVDRNVTRVITMMQDDFINILADTVLPNALTSAFVKLNVSDTTGKDIAEVVMNNFVSSYPTESAALDTTCRLCADRAPHTPAPAAKDAQVQTEDPKYAETWEELHSRSSVDHRVTNGGEGVVLKVNGGRIEEIEVSAPVFVDQETQTVSTGKIMSSEIYME